MTPTPKDVLQLLQNLPTPQARAVLAETLAALDEREAGEAKSESVHGELVEPSENPCHLAIRRDSSGRTEALACMPREEPAAPTLVSSFPKPWEIEDAQLVTSTATAERAFFASSPEPELGEDGIRPVMGRRWKPWLLGLGAACVGLVAGIGFFPGKPPRSPIASAKPAAPPPPPPAAVRSDLTDLPPLVPAPARPAHRPAHAQTRRAAHPDDAFASRH